MKKWVCAAAAFGVLAAGVDAAGYNTAAEDWMIERAARYNIVQEELDKTKKDLEYANIAAEYQRDRALRAEQEAGQIKAELADIRQQQDALRGKWWALCWAAGGLGAALLAALVCIAVLLHQRKEKREFAGVVTMQDKGDPDSTIQAGEKERIIFSRAAKFFISEMVGGDYRERKWTRAFVFTLLYALNALVAIPIAYALGARGNAMYQYGCAAAAVLALAEFAEVIYRRKTRENDKEEVKGEVKDEQKELAPEQKPARKTGAFERIAFGMIGSRLLGFAASDESESGRGMPRAARILVLFVMYIVNTFAVGMLAIAIGAEDTWLYQYCGRIGAVLALAEFGALVMAMKRRGRK